jgi:hypothetical protein
MKVRMLRKLEKWIQAEPRRFDMLNWSGNEYIIRKQKPRCGIVGCLAGMACHMQGLKLTPGAGFLNDDMNDEIFERARAILDLSEKQSARLFFLPDIHHHRSLYWPGEFAAAYNKAKTPKEKVKVAVARIEHFIKTKGQE